MATRAGVIGGGSWGTALARVLTDNHDEVVLWAREPEVVEGINTHRRNPLYQDGVDLPHNIRATGSLTEAVTDVDLVTLVVPSHAMRSVVTRIVDDLTPGVPVVSASKGIENESLMTMEELLTELLPRTSWSDLAFLSGPSFAAEVLQGMATAVTIAARFPEVAEQVQRAFSTDWFRCYATEDVTGVELGGSLKNVIAIAAGIADGMGLGHNSRAALITRGLAEISRLAEARGANAHTLSGLSGMGDLVLTCTGGLSRNRSVGFQLGQGATLADILGGMNQVAEGVKTARSAHMLAEREGVDMPITHEVHAILYDDKPAAEAMRDLMTRSLKHERTG